MPGKRDRKECTDQGKLKRKCGKKGHEILLWGSSPHFRRALQSETLAIFLAQQLPGKPQKGLLRLRTTVRLTLQLRHTIRAAMRSMLVFLRALLIVDVGVVVLVSGCTRSVSHRQLPHPPLSAPPISQPQPSQMGIASWYGPGFHGRPTASGERYDQNGLTAAHRTLPLGSRVEVTNLANGKSVQVRINDRGPFVRGRVIDLSRGAAGHLGMVRRGTSRVRVQVLHRSQTGEIRSLAATRRPRGHQMQAKGTRRKSFLASLWPF